MRTSPESSQIISEISLPHWSRREVGGRPASVDLRSWFLPVLNQRSVPICTAAAVTAIAGYYARRSLNAYFHPSVLFNYRMSRTLSGNPDRWGSTLAFSFAAWKVFGMLEEELWPYHQELVNRDPSRALMKSAFGNSVRYRRIDKEPMTGSVLLGILHYLLASELPVALEFPLHTDLLLSYWTQVLPMPTQVRNSIGSHVVTVVGYNDELDVGENLSSGKSQRGALLVRNSWGESWADGGYGWLPYDYVRHGLARDVWFVEDAWASRD